MSDDDPRHMAHALRLGRRGAGAVWPNPAVGCVIVTDGRVVGRGWTAPGGRPHAETVALAQAGRAASGATAHVTLEPCAHRGQTLPCATALIDAGLAHVVTALEDPDPRVAGRGHAMLRAAGIAVSEGAMAREAAFDQAGFLTRVRHGRPMVTLKLASSFDGRIATGTGESRWITGSAARRAVHAMRLSHDAVMIGGGTARADDPVLTVRGLGARRQPVRVIASAGLDLPRDGRLAGSLDSGPLWLLHGDGASERARAYWAGLGARLIECPTMSGALDPMPMVQALGAAGLTRVFCEGGGALAASLLQAGLVDRLAGFTAGVALGDDGRPALGALGVEALVRAPRFDLVETRRIGPDVMHLWSQRQNGSALASSP